MKHETEKRAQPITLKDGEFSYTLEFNREAVKFAERQGFDVSQVAAAPENNVPILFYAAFRMHHPEVSRAETDRLLFEELGGLTGEELSRLSDLYTQAVDVLRLVQGERKNPRVGLVLL